MNHWMFAFLMLAIGPAWAQQDECDRPWPAVVPAEVGSKEEILEIQRQVKAYLESANAFLDCNQSQQKALTAEDDDTRQKLQVMINHYNSTVDEMHGVGERYNQLVRAYKAQQAAAESEAPAEQSDPEPDGGPG